MWGPAAASPRRVLSLVRGLPRDRARAFRQEYHEHTGGWTVTEHLLARISDQLDAVFRASLAGKVRTLPKAEVTPRPGEKKTGPRKVSWSEMARLQQGRG